MTRHKIFSTIWIKARSRLGKIAIHANVLVVLKFDTAVDAGSLDRDLWLSSVLWFTLKYVWLSLWLNSLTIRTIGRHWVKILHALDALFWLLISFAARTDRYVRVNKILALETATRLISTTIKTYLLVWSDIQLTLHTRHNFY